MEEKDMDLISKVRGALPELESDTLNPSDDVLNVLLIGSPQQNLLGVMNELLGEMNQLDCPMMSGYRGSFVYGESKAAFQTDSGSPVATDMGNLAEKLKKYNKSSVQHQFTVTFDSPVLKGCAIHVLASDSDFEDVNWNAELSRADYILFAMSSTALLSMAERKALRNWLIPYMGSAYGIILTNDNLILEDDRKDINASLQSMFNGEVTIFRTPETDIHRLADVIDSLKKDVAGCHEKRNSRAERLFLTNAKNAVELQLKVFSENKADIEETVSAIKESIQKLPSRQKSAFRYARMQYISPSKLDAAETINGFQKDINNKLKEEIEREQNPGDLSDILPSYIADAWRNQADVLFENIQKETASMQKDLQVYIEKDIRNYIEGCVGGERADYVYALTEKYFKITDSFVIHDEDNQFLYDAPKDNTKAKYYGVIASGIALVLFSHPVVGIAVATIGSKKIKKSSELQLNEDKRNALYSACEELNREYHSDMMAWLDSVFDSVEANIKASVDECYQKMVDSIVQALNKRMTDQNDYEEKLSELHKLKEEIDVQLAV